VKKTIIAASLAVVLGSGMTSFASADDSVRTQERARTHQSGDKSHKVDRRGNGQMESRQGRSHTADGSGKQKHKESGQRQQKGASQGYGSGFSHRYGGDGSGRGF